MAFPVSKIADRASSILNDLEQVRWTASELLLWCEEAIDQLLRFVPKAGAETKVLKLTTGKSRQEFPDVREILEVTVNTDGTGTPVGPSITLTTRHSLDACASEWRNEEGEFVRQWVYEPEHNASTFWVYPYPGDELWVEATVVMQQDITSLSVVVPIGKQYISTLVNYVMFRAMSKNADFGGNAQTAIAYLNAFYTDTGQYELIQTRTDPNVTMEERNRG